MSEYVEVKSSYCITINTDASFNAEHKASGYCFYIIHCDFRIGMAGRFKKSKPDNIQEAETMAIGNSIAYLLLKDNLPKIKCIVINSDCIPAMHQIENRTTKLGKKISSLLKELKKRTGATKVKFTHVKAHSSVKDGRSYINKFCDKGAKEQMTISLNEILSVSGKI